jgi:GH24 family phage-related lysozyme (muramidase)
MRVSDEGLALIKREEGLRLDAYRDTGGVWTIGYGHTAKAGPPAPGQGMKITRSEAEAILRRDVAAVERDVNRLVKVPLTQGQFDALVSFTFNVGTPEFSTSTLLRRVNAKRFDDVPAQFMRWVYDDGRKFDGLVRRRRRETAMWRGLTEPTAEKEGDGRRKPKVAPPADSKGFLAKIAAAAGLVASALADSLTDWRVIVGITVAGVGAYLAYEAIQQWRERRS